MAQHLDENIVCVLAHTRKATKGNPFKNENNHPLINGAGVVIHNGMLSNDDNLFRELKLERGAETDSDILRAILDSEGGVTKEALKALNKISGSVASALAHPSDPTKLMLLRSGNPLVCADDGEKFYFASDKRAIYRAARPWIERHGMPMQLQAPNIAFITMPNDTGWIIGSQGLEWHGPFSASSIRWRYTNYSDVYSPHGRSLRRDYLAKKAEEESKKAVEEAQRDITIPDEDDDEPTVVQPRVIEGNTHALVNYVRCPTEACRNLLALSEDQSKLPLTRLRCPHCKTNLNGAARSMRLLSKQPDESRPVVH